MKGARPNRNHAWAVLGAIFGYLPFAAIALLLSFVVGGC